MMMNGQSREADRSRMERIARATGQSMGSLHEQVDARDYRPVKQPKMYNENRGQHYPDFLDRESPKIEVKQVVVSKPKKVVRGKALTEDKYKSELHAQRKRAEALAWLAQTEDGVPDDCLKGEAAVRRRQQQRSQLSRDNTLKLVGERQAADTYKKLQSKLLDLQTRLRARPISNHGSLSHAESTGVVAPSTVAASAPLPPGWRAVEHLSSRQTYYVHCATGEQRWSLPTGSTSSTDIPTSKPEHDDEAKPSPRSAPRKRQREVDPLDPGGGSGRWSDGLHHKGERMADSTATGPLWQQRPYPAPSEVLRMRGPGVREGSSIGPSMPTSTKPTSKPIAFVPRQASRKRPM